MKGKRRTILSKIVSKVERPDECFDVRKCSKHVIAESSVRDLGPDESASSHGTLAKSDFAKVTKFIVQLWARMSLGESSERAVKDLVVNIKRGARTLSKIPSDRIASLMPGIDDPMGEFERAAGGIAITISDEDGSISVSRDALENVAKVYWFGRFTWAADSKGAIRGIPRLSDVTVDEPTAIAVNLTANRIVAIIEEYGGVTDYRHRCMAPKGSGDIRYWEYELSSDKAVWVLSGEANIYNSRIAAMLVSLYFFILDDGLFGYSELSNVRTIGCIGLSSGDYMTLDICEISHREAIETMKQVNGYDDDRIEDLLWKHDLLTGKVEGITADDASGVAGCLEELEIPSHRNRKVRKSERVGKIELPSEHDLEKYLKGHGRTSLYKLLDATVKQKNGRVIPLTYYEPIPSEKITRPGELSGIDETTDEVRDATYIVQLMIRVRMSETPDILTTNGRYYKGAELLASAIDRETRSLEYGNDAENIEGELSQLIEEARADEIGDMELARLCTKINWYGQFANPKSISNGNIVRYDSVGNDDRMLDICTTYYRRAMRSISAIGSRIIACDVECTTDESRYIKTAQIPYLTDKALVRMTFTKNDPNASSVLSDAVCRCMAIIDGKIEESVSMAIVNPRLGTASIIPMEKIDAINSVSKKVVHAICPEL